MNITQYLALAIRLFSVILFIYGLRQVGTIFEVVIHGSINGAAISTLFVVVVSLIPILIAVLLWKFPLMIARSIIKPEMDKEVKPLSQADWLSVFLISIGTFTFYYAVTDAIYWLYMFQILSDTSIASYSYSQSQEDKLNFVLTMLELGMSLLLILKSKALSQRLLKLSH